MVKLYKDGITIEVAESDVDFYIRIGFKKVKDAPEEKPKKTAGK